MESLFLTNQSLSLWSGSTDSKTLDYQRNKSREYQIVRTHTKETTEYKTRHHPTTSSTLCRTPHLNNKQNKNTSPGSFQMSQFFTSGGQSIGVSASASVLPMNIGAIQSLLWTSHSPHFPLAFLAHSCLVQ